MDTLRKVKRAAASIPTVIEVVLADLFDCRKTAEEPWVDWVKNPETLNWDKRHRTVIRCCVRWRGHRGPCRDICGEEFGR